MIFDFSAMFNSILVYYQFLFLFNSFSLHFLIIFISFTLIQAIGYIFCSLSRFFTLDDHLINKVKTSDRDSFDGTQHILNRILIRHIAQMLYLIYLFLGVCYATKNAMEQIKKSFLGYITIWA